MIAGFSFGILEFMFLALFFFHHLHEYLITETINFKFPKTTHSNFLTIREILLMLIYPIYIFAFIGLAYLIDAILGFLISSNDYDILASILSYAIIYLFLKIIHNTITNKSSKISNKDILDDPNF